MSTHRLVALIAAAAVSVALTACGSSSKPKQQTFDVWGGLTVSADLAQALTSPRAGAECVGIDAAASVTPGAPVVIFDSHGAKIGLGTLGPGANTKRTGTFTGAPCVFGFSVPEITVKSTDIYSIKIGDLAEFTFSREQAEGLALTFG